MLPLQLFVKVVSRVAVPAFFIISGAVFFRDYQPSSYYLKIKNRFHSLVVPYLCWNVIWMLFGGITTLFFSQYFVGRPPSDISFLGAIKSILFHADYLPFWFICNLILYILATPIIYVLLKNRVVGGFVVAFSLVIIYILNCHWANFFKMYFVDAESIIYYLLGAYIGIHFFEWFSTDSKRKATIGIIGVITCISLKFVFDFFTDNLIGRTMILSVFALCLLFSFNIFSNSYKDRYPEFFKHSFWVYAVHLNLSVIITKILFMAFPKTISFAWINLFLTMILTLIGIEALARVTYKYTPSLYRVLSGDRK